MKLSRFACLLTLAGTLQAQAINAPVVVAEKNVAELQKTRAVLVINGADGQHPPPEADLAATAQFTRAISEQLERLTCWKLLPGTSPTKKRPGETSTSLMTYVEYKEVPYARYTTPYHAVFQFTVQASNGTLWDGSKEIEPPAANQKFYTSAQIQGVVADMLQALARDACPGMPTSGTRPAAVPPTASFDCSKAVSRTEKLICSSAALSNADAVMAVWYRRSMTLAGNIFPDAAAHLKRDQIEWIKENAACKDGACLQKRYDERIAFLKEYYEAAHDGGDVNALTTAAFLGRYPAAFRILPDLLRELKSLLGDTYPSFEEAMGLVHEYPPSEPGTITGNMSHMNCAVEAIVSVNGGRRLSVAITVGGKGNAISVFSTPRVTRLDELPKVKRWVEEYRKRCETYGPWEVILR
jgi:uncharacterized protein